MKINSVESPGNNLLKTIRSLKQRHTREKTGLFLIEGKKPVAEALEKRLPIKDILVSQTYLKDDAHELAAFNVKAVSVVDDKTFKELATTVTPEGIMAVAKTPHHELDDLFVRGKASLIVIADGIQDPGNLGTILRTALAASVSGIVLTKGTVDPYNPKVVRSAMGALFALPVVTDLSFDETAAALKERGVRLVACEPTAEKFYFDADLKSAVAVVLGNEGQGFSRSHLKEMDELVAIPMDSRSESLNVAVSAAIVLFSAVQQRLTAQR